jgi:2-polyprenyl-6-methoxyphenol hydroxylase-like FAD-dependent oxidoreductase
MESMADDHPNPINLQIPEQDKVVIVGGGPVGLTASLFLSKYHIPHILVEQLAKPDNHPQAHFINCRSMEIFRELNRLDRDIYDRSAPADEWRRFVYCTGLADLPALNHIESASAGSLLGVVDHFADFQDNIHSPGQVTHFPQHDFVRLLRKAALKRPFCHSMEGFRAKIQEDRQRLAVMLIEARSGRCQQIETQYVVAADGAHSSTRKQLGIELVSDTGTLQHLINVHFFSPQLAEHLRSRIPAMLYFIYTRFGVAVWVAHAFKRGEFVAQIPYFPPYQRPEDFDSQNCTQLLQRLAGKQIAIEVRSIRRWRMGIGLASRFRSKWGRCFLIGDAAHQFTPAGGYGMNTGIQDAHNLIWKIALALRSETADQKRSAERLLSSYEAERRSVARLNAKLSVENYLITLKIPSAIGLNMNLLFRLHRLIRRLPEWYRLKRSFFQAAMRLGLKQVDWLKSNHPLASYRRRAIHKIFSDAKHQTLQLLFPGQDMGFVYGTGALIGQKTRVRDRMNPFVFKPELKIGGRIPHFWLVDPNGRRKSVLDLPTLMLDSDRVPKYVLLQAGKIQVTEREINLPFGQSIVTVCISQSGSTAKNHYAYHTKRPAFLPPSFAVLIRPDGHIAWLQLP